MKKITKFLEYLECQGIFWENIFCKVYKSINHQKGNLISLSLFFFFFHENIMYTSEVTALLVEAYVIHWQIFGHFLPPLAQIFNQI